MDILAFQKWAYVQGAPSYSATAYSLLHHYSGIPETEVDTHLLHIVSLHRVVVVELER